MKGKCKEVETLFRIGKEDGALREIRENFRKRRINANIGLKMEKTLTEGRDKFSRYTEKKKHDSVASGQEWFMSEDDN